MGTQGHELWSRPFFTSVLELKLDQATMFKWQQYTQDTKKVLQYQVLLNFLDLRAQASEKHHSWVRIQVWNTHGRKEVLPADTIVHS